MKIRHLQLRHFVVLDRICAREPVHGSGRMVRNLTRAGLAGREPKRRELLATNVGQAVNAECCLLGSWTRARKILKPRIAALIGSMERGMKVGRFSARFR